MATTKKKPTPKAPTKAPATSSDPITVFENAEAFDAWLRQHHASDVAIYLKLGKGGHPPHLTYAQALDVALSWGWIDSQKRPHDHTAWLQRFGPRTKKSPWSKINVAKAEALIAAGKMQPSGLHEVERAKADGRWQAAYDSPKTATVPEDLAAALEKSPQAARLFAALDSANRFAILYRVQSVKKAETRARKITDCVAMLARGEVFHPDRLPKKK